MNERFKELAIESGAMKFGDFVIPATMDIEKFAHSVMKEYINTLCVCMDKHGVEMSNYPTWYKVMIETDKHFGIEE